MQDRDPLPPHLPPGSDLQGFDARGARLRQEIAVWNALLESELGPPLPAVEESEETEEVPGTPAGSPET